MYQRLLIHSLNGDFLNCFHLSMIRNTDPIISIPLKVLGGYKFSARQIAPKSAIIGSYDKTRLSLAL